MAIRILHKLLCGFLGHRWDQWGYEKAAECGQRRICSRCCADERRGPIHTWGEWSYEKAAECGQRRTCSRCSADERRGPIHTWGASHETCRRCGEVNDVSTSPDIVDPCDEISSTCGMGCDPT